MNRPMRAFFTLMMAAAFTSIAQEQSKPADAAPNSIVLHYPFSKAVDEKAFQSLYTQAEALLESSNFNTRGTRRWTWDFSRFQEQYRQTVDGKYFLVSFSELRKFQTIGGEATVREIVIGLNHPQYASSLFTIDDEGRVVGHAKYSGPLCVKFLETVKKITGDN